MEYHHLVYGELVDNITGEILRDTDDERARQEIHRLLLEDKSYSVSQLLPRQTIHTSFAGIDVVSKIAVVVSVGGCELLLVRYAPGSLVTRERSAIAAARLINARRNVPFAVLTNGANVELINSSSGKVIGYGVDSIPDAATAEELLAGFEYKEILSDKQREKEMRILNAFDREVCCLGR